MKQNKILLVDEEEDIRDALRELLSQENYIVLEATNGEEGIA